MDYGAPAMDYAPGIPPPCHSGPYANGISLPHANGASPPYANGISPYANGASPSYVIPVSYAGPEASHPHHGGKPAPRPPSVSRMRGVRG
ncbi:uncharacterized protein SCHCODRAFT_02520581 [Schizophyllum commune H4-8]|uniref:Uncharacterized protein n=1 Tax=Schizophyllum commune (strain H4-8 / FGSC 9210) TaxID=578458 RepID=D8QL77_SCHCM|nr:uncharacterized protein SCHCODRAFT_02520581 [Schizophyllum commune H4-8]KAI5885247.1 hypothetical protein SCHCODRAFT_02520581 [Schizophyllum commune H4-8]